MTLHPFAQLSLEELKVWLSNNNIPVYRAEQMFHWIYKDGIIDFHKMTNLPVFLRNNLTRHFKLPSLKLIREQSSALDQTKKYLFELTDGQTIESVVMPYPRRCTICVSTQAGCRFHCVFCASGNKGLKRNLSPDEIIEQVLMGTRQERRITHIVFMGMGEPLDNIDNVVNAIRIFNHPKAFNIGARRMTISTCGIPEGIRRLIDLKLQVELSVSLHASNNELRSRLMPVNKQYPLQTLTKELLEYTKKTNRQITFEYIMLDGLNLSDKNAQELGQLLKGIRCKINLIPFNDTKIASGLKPPAASAIKRFQRALNDKSLKNTVRDSRGGDINGACGQLSLSSKTST